MVDLKPCPFPHDDDLPPPEIQRHPTAGYHYAACECGATGPARSTVDEAVAAWNRRAPLADATAAEVEAAALATWNRDAIKPFDGLPGIFKDACLEDARAALAAFVAGRTGG